MPNKSEQLFDECLAVRRSHKRWADFVCDWMIETLGDPGRDTDSQLRAFHQVAAYLAHQKPVDRVLADRKAANFRAQHADDVATIRAHPEENPDPFACRTPKGLYGNPIR